MRSPDFPDSHSDLCDVLGNLVIFIRGPTLQLKGLHGSSANNLVQTLQNSFWGVDQSSFGGTSRTFTIIARCFFNGWSVFWVKLWNELSRWTVSNGAGHLDQAWLLWYQPSSERFSTVHACVVLLIVLWGNSLHWTHQVSLIFAFLVPVKSKQHSTDLSGNNFSDCGSVVL